MSCERKTASQLFPPPPLYPSSTTTTPSTPMFTDGGGRGLVGGGGGEGGEQLTRCFLSTGHFLHCILVTSHCVVEHAWQNRQKLILFSL